ncbi:MAG: DUF72 domain-containing protein [Candidatus Binataceae bacterium]
MSERQAGAIRIGTSGFSYKEWVGGFYPAKTPGAKMLEYYAERLPTVEINMTFRRLPTRKLLEGWASKTPAHFRFALKAPQRVTHFAKLRGTEEVLDYFIETAGALGERIAPTLFQLPPNFTRDTALLKDFLAQLNGRIPVAFEFRDKSWFDDSTLAALSDAKAALCIAESEKLATPVVRTAPYVYLRLRMENYDDTGLAEWAKRISKFVDDGTKVFAYFKHEVSAPDLANRLRALLSGAI